MVYRTERGKFPPQGRMNQIRAAKQHEVGRSRVCKPPAKLYRKRVGITEEEKKDILDVVKAYHEQMQMIFNFLAHSGKQLSSLTVTVTN